MYMKWLCVVAVIGQNEELDQKGCVQLRVGGQGPVIERLRLKEMSRQKMYKC